MHRSQHSSPFLLGVSILEIMNIPIPRFAHFPLPSAELSPVADLFTWCWSSTADGS